MPTTPKKEMPLGSALSFRGSVLEIEVLDSESEGEEEPQEQVSDLLRSYCVSCIDNLTTYTQTKDSSESSDFDVNPPPKKKCKVSVKLGVAKTMDKVRVRLLQSPVETKGGRQQGKKVPAVRVKSMGRVLHSPVLMNGTCLTVIWR